MVTCLETFSKGHMAAITKATRGRISPDLPSERLVAKMPPIFMRFGKLLGGDTAETLIEFQSD